MSDHSDQAPRAVEFIAPLGAPSRRTRVQKFMRKFTELGWHVTFAGWEREPGELAAEPEVVGRALLRGGGYTSRGARWRYPLWMAAVFLDVLRAGRRRNFVCLGWETAFPALLAARLTGARIIFDDADRFSLILHLRGPLNRLLQSLERWASRRALVHIVPGLARYEWRGDNMIVLRNTPSRADFDTARRTAPPRPNADLVLYANGWLGETRGAPMFLAALDRLAAQKRKIVMIVAGRVDSPAGQRLIEHPLVRFHGEVAQDAALALYAASDVVLTFYDPKVPINRQAESNKWGDAIAFGTPFIVNSEVVTARDFVAAGAAWAVPYADTDALVALLGRLCEQRSQIVEAGARIAEFAPQFPLFDEQLAKIALLLECRN